MPTTTHCRICGVLFEKKASNHVICGPDCRAIAAKEAMSKWRKNNPEKHKQNQQSQYKNRARDRRIKNRDKRTPGTKVKRRCVYMVKQDDGTKKRCNRVTANGGQNYMYCAYHHTLITNDIADDSYIFIDGGENLVEQFSEAHR